MTVAVTLLGDGDAELLSAATTLSDEDIDRTAKELAFQRMSVFELADLLGSFDGPTQQKLAAALIANGGDAGMVSQALKRAIDRAPKTEGIGGKIWGGLATASSIAGAYHGYRRNNKSIGWAVWWFLAGGLFFPLTPALMVAQGFGQPKGTMSGASLKRRRRRG